MKETDGTIQRIGRMRMYKKLYQYTGTALEWGSHGICQMDLNYHLKHEICKRLRNVTLQILYSHTFFLLGMNHKDVFCSER